VGEIRSAPAGSHERSKASAQETAWYFRPGREVGHSPRWGGCPERSTIAGSEAPLLKTTNAEVSGDRIEVIALPLNGEQEHLLLSTLVTA